MTSDLLRIVFFARFNINYQQYKGKKNILHKQEKYLFFNNLDYLYITNLICN